jgi:hypothetical protein
MVSNIYNETEEVVIQAIQEYAQLKCKQLLEIVAEKAEIEWDAVNNYTDLAHISKDSILNCVNLEEFCF